MSSTKSNLIDTNIRNIINDAFDNLGNELTRSIFENLNQAKISLNQKFIASNITGIKKGRFTLKKIAGKKSKKIKKTKKRQ